MKHKNLRVTVYSFNIPWLHGKTIQKHIMPKFHTYWPCANLWSDFNLVNILKLNQEITDINKKCHEEKKSKHQIVYNISNNKQYLHEHNKHYKDIVYKVLVFTICFDDNEPVVR